MRVRMVSPESLLARLENSFWRSLAAFLYHEPLTRVFSSPMILSHLKTDLTWLRDQVLTAIRRGDERAAIHDANLIPPDLLANQPDSYQPYYILREHVIDRIYDQNVGYWQANLGV